MVNLASILFMPIFGAADKQPAESEIWGFHGGDDNYDIVLGFGAVWPGRYMPAFRRNILSPSSGLKLRCWESEGLYRGAGREVHSFRLPFL
jgi:hypothetical protein